MGRAVEEQLDIALNNIWCAVKRTQDVLYVNNVYVHSFTFLVMLSWVTSSNIKGDLTTIFGQDTHLLALLYTFIAVIRLVDVTCSATRDLMDLDPAMPLTQVTSLDRIKNRARQDNNMRKLYHLDAIALTKCMAILTFAKAISFCLICSNQVSVTVCIIAKCTLFASSLCSILVYTGILLTNKMVHLRNRVGMTLVFLFCIILFNLIQSSIKSNTLQWISNGLLLFSKCMVIEQTLL